MMTYHDPVVGTIRPSVESDCSAIALDMREADIQEAWSALRFSPIEISRYSFNKSFFSMTIEHDGKPVAMFGIMSRNLIDESGVIWLLTTNGIKDIGRIFVRNSKEWIKSMFQFYPTLWGIVDLRNTVSIRWLAYLGCEWEGIVLFGVDEIPFKKFYFKKDEI